MLIGKSHKELEEMTVEFTKRSKEAGLTLNTTKTKIITNVRTFIETEVDDQIIEEVKQTDYLGQMNSFKK